MGYRALANSTRVEVDRYYRMFLNEFGDRLVADISAAEIDRRMDQTDMLENPGKALNYLEHLQNLFELGIRRDYRKDKHNPAAGAPVPECGERLPWPDDV